MLDQFHNDGFLLLRSVFAPERVADVIQILTGKLADAANAGSVLQGRLSPAYGARNLLSLWPAALNLLHEPVLSSTMKILPDPVSGVVRGLFFDKPPGHSWALPWHRDYTIAVRQHLPSSMFSKPTVKAGVPHVEAPQSLLERMVSVRIHLDAMDDENGALRVVPGSHRVCDDKASNAISIQCAAGDVLLMRPLLLHSSGHCAENCERHRRIVHLECTATRTLPDGYEWHDFAELCA